MLPSQSQSLESLDRRLWPLMTITAIALVIGMYGRFIGLGLWPFGVDEFYISRSIDNIVRSGLPEFACGGYYTRGIIYQYVVAGLRNASVPAEFASRVVTAVSSLAIFPGAYLLGKRLRGPVVGLIVVTVLALSMWEIEMARFARMYVPFQAVFTWHLVYFLRYSIDRDRSALAPMIGLSFLGAALWEGGALLGVVNLFAVLIRQPDGRFKAADWRYIAAMTGLVAVLSVAMFDLRGLAELPGSDVAQDTPTGPHPLFVTVSTHPAWAALLLLPIACAAFATPFILRFRTRWLAALGMVAMLALAFSHQLVAVAIVLVLLLAGGFVSWKELFARPAIWFWLSLVLVALYWIAFGVLTDSWRADPTLHTSMISKTIQLSSQFSHFPNVVEKVARPWLRSIPLTSFCLATAIAALFWRSVRGHDLPPSLNAALFVLLSLLVVIGAAPVERLETRYTFFLYPLLVVLAVSALDMLRERWKDHVSTPALCSVALIVFFWTDDFQPWHLLNVASPAMNYRLGLSDAKRAHYYPRSDVRSAALWLAIHKGRDDKVFIDVPSVDQYYDHIDGVFLRDGDPRYEAYACKTGTTERWTGRPLVYSAKALDTELQSARNVFLVVYADESWSMESIADDLGWRHAMVWESIDHGIRIIKLQRLR